VARDELLAEWLRRSGKARRSHARIPRRDTNGPAPLSFTQQRLWFLDQLTPGSAVYNAPVALRMRGALDVPSLERGIEEIGRRHDVLRMYVAEVDGEPVQALPATTAIRLRHHDLSGLAVDAREAELERMLHLEAQSAFELRRGPLMRAGLVRLDEREHVLMMTFHHMVADEWSGNVFARELGALYGECAEGAEPGLPMPEIQYADYAVWQRECLQGENLASQLAYWRKTLANAPSSLELPSDRARPAVQSYEGDAVDFALAEGLTSALEELARSASASPFMVAFAAFVGFLHRLTGQSDLLVGTPIAGRTRAEVQAMIGFFANTLVLRGDCSGDPTFRELIARVKTNALGAYAHQDLPFDSLVQELHPARDLSRHPLFQVMFTWQDEPMQELRLGDLTITRSQVHTRTSKFDLSLYMHRRPGGTGCTVEYSTQLFDRETVERYALNFQTLLRAAIEQPDRPLSRLPLLDERERRRLLVEWNETAMPFPDCCAHHLFESQARRSPDSVAARHLDAQLTYRELDARANRLARQLREIGVGRKARVGICIERSLELPAALLAVLKAGGAYVPLDPSYPDSRIEFMLEETGARALLTQTALLGRFAGAKAHVLAADAIAAQDTPEAPFPADNAKDATPDDTAYVIYTSGSTGQPKGVEICHGSVVNFLTYTRRIPGLTRDDVVLAVSTVCFDIALFELLLPLVVGAELVIASEQEVRDGTALLERLRGCRATVLDATPVTWRMLLAAGWGTEAPLKAISTGEALSPELAEELRTRSSELWNLYGPTESTVWAAWHRVDGEARPMPIGRPVPNTQLYVLDAYGEPVPVGVTGELHIGGAGVARGYLNRPELSGERFKADPFGAPGSRLYQTGDLVRFRSDGVLDYLGRRDEQVKLRGHRIELGEIEARLSGHAAVAEAAVVIHQRDHEEPRLIAFVVAQPGLRPTIEDLRQFLARSLPGFMIPAEFRLLSKLPVNANGKVDRRILQSSAGERLDSSIGYVSARTPTARCVADVWRQTLGVERVGLHDNFFELGGHSLGALQVQKLLSQALDREISVVALFQYPTLQALSEYLDGNAPVRGELMAVEERTRRRREGAAASMRGRTRR
jgi:amino acid adenylation domain-containing protein